MIRWCAYCLHFIGEAEPYGTYQITHGVCTGCVPKVLALTRADQEAVKGLQAFYRALQHAVRTGRPLDLETLLAESRAQGITAEDLLFGLLQPLLEEIGELWADGALTVAAEHRFSLLASDLLAQLRADAPETRAPVPSRLLLVNVPGNEHTLGLRMAELFFTGQGLGTCLVLPGPSLPGLLELVAQHRPEVLGFSVAMPGQLHYVEEAAALLAAHPGRPRHLLVGGPAVRLGAAPEPSLGLRAIRQLHEVTALLETGMVT